MKEEYKKYLPLGTVVLLKNGTKRVMITGYAAINMETKDKIFDYCGCLYPEGVISTTKNILFNHVEISKLYCIGYSDEEQKKYIEYLEKQMGDGKNQEELLKKLQSGEITPE